VFSGFQSTLADPGRTKADAAGQCSAGVAGDGVLVDHDAGQIQQTGGDLTPQRETGAALDFLSVDHHDVGVGAAVDHLETALLESFCQGFGVNDGALLQQAVLVSLRQAGCHGNSGELVGMRAALCARENGVVDLSSPVLVGGQDDRPTRAAQRFVGGEDRHVGDTDRVRVNSADHEPGAVGDIGH
jgi:hypothetical protein